MLASTAELVDSLRQKLASFERELVEWEKLSRAAHPPWNRHQSQILRLHALFTGCSEALATQIAALDQNAAGTLASVRELNGKILQAHAFWSYFRDKLLQRNVAGLVPYLLAADEFAWRCFKPCLEARAAALDRRGLPLPAKSPPLVYLGPEISPLVYPRTFRTEIPNVSDALFQDLLKSAPLSVVSLPYYQTTHLPEALVLGHEIGHVVDFDLELTGALDAAVAQVTFAQDQDERRRYWQQCRVEAFADAFGTVVGGASFLLALGHFLARARPEIVAERMPARPRKYEYPTVYLRILLCLEVLRQDGRALPARAAAFLEAWRNAYGREHAYRAHEEDLPALAAALVDTPLDDLDGRTVREAANGLRAEDEKLVEADLKRAVGRGKIEAKDPRLLLATAAAVYYTDRTAYARQDVHERILAAIRANADDAPRRAASVRDSQKSRDRATGAGLLAILGAGAEGPDG